MADPVTMGIMMAMQAEGMRKQHVSGRIAREQQEDAAQKAEQRAKEQEEKRTAMRIAKQAADRNVQTTAPKSPFATKRKGNMRSQFTIGGNTGGGGNSGVNY
tara:strand:+ start:290 stop:595 length:306 start_codon:yes stop_codon:yes gene_type:complete